MPPRRRTKPWEEPTYGPNRWAWLQLGRLEIVAYSGREGGRELDPEDIEPSYADGLGVEPVRLSFQRGNRMPMTLVLNYYTVKELETMRELFNKVLDVAVERSAVLDAEAHRVNATGNDSIPRTWRPEPQIMERPHVLTRTALPDTVDPQPDPTIE